MEDQSASVAGECAPWPSKAGMVALLRNGGLQIVEGRHSVRVKDCEHFVFQHFDGIASGPTLDADAETVAQMLADTALVSRALASANVRHRFEVYGPGDALVGYFHHEWPNEVQPFAAADS